MENDSITTYTLNVVISDEDNNSFTNILFIEKDNMLRRYFLKYTPTESWKNAVLEGGVYSGFEGSITFVDDSGQGFSFLENYPINEYSSSFGGCLAVFYTENTPCCLNISCCPCTDGNGVTTLVIDIQCPGGGSSGDDPGDNPWNGLLPDNGGGSEGGGTGPGIIQQIPTEPNFDYMVIHNLNTLLQTPLTFQQEEWILENEENYQYALEVLDAIINETTVVDAPDEPIVDIEEFLSCFDTTQNATVTLYANQPFPSNPNMPITPSLSVGHAFVSIEQGSHLVSYGFYPASGVGYPNPTSGTFGNDEQQNFDVSVSIGVNGQVLETIITHSISYELSEYDLRGNNCTDFTISTGNIAGFTIPLTECEGNFVIGKGSTPGMFGDYIRNMTLTSGATRNTSGGMSPTNNECE